MWQSARNVAKMSDQDIELCDLVEELHDVRMKWYKIGLQLKVPDKILDEIESNKDDNETALRKMLQTWLNRNPNASWAGIVRALNARSVGESTLASNIETRKNCAVSSTTTHAANAVTLQRNAVAACKLNI